MKHDLNTFLTSRTIDDIDTAARNLLHICKTKRKFLTSTIMSPSFNTVLIPQRVPNKVLFTPHYVIRSTIRSIKCRFRSQEVRQFIPQQIPHQVPQQIPQTDSTTSSKNWILQRMFDVLIKIICKITINLS